MMGNVPVGVSIVVEKPLDKRKLKKLIDKM